jgi:hypothetical protein
VGLKMFYLCHDVIVIRKSYCLSFGSHIGVRQRFSSCVAIVISCRFALHAENSIISQTDVSKHAFQVSLSQSRFLSNRPGLFYGQCSEICRANHRCIPNVNSIVNDAAYA